jgi:peroxiredoxin Q/BCP
LPPWKEERFIVKSKNLEPGMIAPPFNLEAEDGRVVSSSDFAGQKLIVYFYPAASTPGCTTQACDFRDNMGSLKAAGYVVLGISKDALPALQKFADEESLDFPLLSDSDLAVHHAYGAYGEKTVYGKQVVGVIRSTFVINEAGLIDHALYNVRATGHVVSLRKQLRLSE